MKMTQLETSSCGMCRSIEELEHSGGDGFVVARTQTGYVSIFFAQYFKGHTVFTSGPPGSDAASRRDGPGGGGGLQDPSTPEAELRRPRQSRPSLALVPRSKIR